MKTRILTIIFLAATSLAFVACRHDDEIFIPEKVSVSKPEYSDIEGMYLLNEGNMGSNKCTLDYYDFTKGEYVRNIYGNANPSVPKELGDVGNDLAIYGSRLYAVVNCSNKVEVMDAATCRRIGQVDIPNCRYIKFYGGYAYVTSYAGPVDLNPEHSQRGYVAQIDTATLAVRRTCIVGYQPDGLEIVDGKIYVANSGGYMKPNYENKLSVIDIQSFSVEEEIGIAVNLQYVCCDSYGGLWVSSRGDYSSIQPRLYCYDIRKRRLLASLDVPVSDMHIDGDSLYVVSTAWSDVTMTNENSYAIVDVKQKAVVARSFITDGSEAAIRRPYGISVNPLNKDIYVTDARSYITPGYLYCYDRNGKMKWSVRTGDIPAHIAYYGKNVASRD